VVVTTFDSRVMEANFDADILPTLDIYSSWIRVWRRHPTYRKEMHMLRRGSRSCMSVMMCSEWKLITDISSSAHHARQLICWFSFFSLTFRDAWKVLVFRLRWDGPRLSCDANWGLITAHTFRDISPLSKDGRMTTD
jgi:hypothetical protein